MNSHEIVLCHPVRTAIGAFNGSLRDVPATELGAAAVRETLRRAGERFDPSAIDTVVLGNVIQAGNRMNPARQASVAGGVPVSVPALTVNRVCGSGAQAIATVATEIASGIAQLGVAGGMENMDRAPYLLDGGRHGYRMGNAQIHDSLLRDGLVDAFSGEHSGWHTEDLVTQSDITREAQDRWAERSQQRFAAAQAKGLFDAEIVGIDVKAGKQMVAFARDEQPRPDTTVATLGRLRPAFRPDGTITAGNAPGLNSGAAAMLVADRRVADRRGIEPFVRLVAFGIGAVEPGMFGLGPVPAVQQALQRAGWTLSDLERIEINEAFAAVPIAVARKLGLPDDIVNVDGGAIAHGHPIGATGAVLTTRLAHAMRRDGVRRAMVTLCIGGGQGIALALETLN
ncbi:acetyl-CoA acetyltransferase [Caballeronia arationis]|jgi:acetyl-CoA C-acetyltransferase|uniref:Acetyl-CoA C-acetyltransferase n=1 Tax=Caballeronia arationis TaxID=1777142 RepID=A0A7Z7I519_9BURK|nr:thiolase family protein [Caballeronia arationis]SAK75497.1 acetyl-CoA acetyltransferase [Caballeronia arationis]SOE62985.1 acetyl-CoA C-acetyltransferase [Caballeronia arationis]